MQQPWEKDKETLEWFKAAAAEVREQATRHPDFPIPVDPDVAEFMGAFEDPIFKDEDFYPDAEYQAEMRRQESPASPGEAEDDQLADVPVIIISGSTLGDA